MNLTRTDLRSNHDRLLACSAAAKLEIAGGCGLKKISQNLFRIMTGLRNPFSDVQFPHSDPPSDAGAGAGPDTIQHRCSYKNN